MAKTTKIEWADATWNPWMGCTKISEGCANCYARRFWNLHGIKSGEVRRTSDRTFQSILSTTKYPSGSRVFVCSMSDFFHDQVEMQWSLEATEMMGKRRDLTFLLLTKRPERLHEWASSWNVHRMDYGEPSHIWLGVTAENQERADERIPELLNINWPGKRFVSVEPQLGLVELSRVKVPEDKVCLATHAYLEYHFDALSPHADEHYHQAPRTLDWVICGGESGHGARPFDLDWARSLRDECDAVGAPFFFKQTRGLHPEKMPALDGKQWAEIPADG